MAVLPVGTVRSWVVSCLQMDGKWTAFGGLIDTVIRIRLSLLELLPIRDLLHWSFEMHMAF